MNCVLLTVGKTDVKWVKEGLDVYTSRIGHYVPFRVTEIPELKKVSALSRQQIKEKEGELLLRQVSPSDTLILLDENGREFRSVEFASYLEKMLAGGGRNLVFAVGGARTPGWTAMGLPMMHLLGVSNQMIPVDYMEGYGMGDRVSPLFDQPYMDRVFRLGKNVGEQVGLEREKMEWRGDWEGVCPSCHGTTLTYRGDGTKVECTVCGSIGDLSIEDGKIKVTYPADEIARGRYQPGGLVEHYEEIQSMVQRFIALIKERGAEIPELEKELDFIKSDKPEKRTILKKV